MQTDTECAGGWDLPLALLCEIQELNICKEIQKLGMDTRLVPIYGSVSAVIWQYSEFGPHSSQLSSIDAPVPMGCVLHLVVVVVVTKTSSREHLFPHCGAALQLHQCQNVGWGWALGLQRRK